MQVQQIIPGHLFRTPFSCHTSGSWRAVVEHVAAVAFVHDLAVIGHFTDIGSIIVEAHVAHQEDFAVFNVAGEWAIDC